MSSTKSWIYSEFQVAGALTLPFDVVKTHRQIDIGESELFTGQILLFDKFIIIFIVYGTNPYIMFMNFEICPID